jgi:hypothetical protein
MQKLRPIESAKQAELLLAAEIIETCEQAEARLRNAWKELGHKIPDEGLKRRTEHAIVKKMQADPANKVTGYFGCWDYPNKDWERAPTLADVPEIMRQKSQRYPESNLWRSEEEMLKWFKSKGW